MMRMNKKPNFFYGRYLFFIVCILILFALLILRMANIQIFDRKFLQKQGDARTVRVITTPATRGMILDRNNEPLAISIPVKSVWVNPKEFSENFSDKKKLESLAKILKTSSKSIIKKTNKYKNNNKEFAYLKRQLSPDLENRILDLGLKGLYFQTEYKRFYPHGEVSSHVIGITNIDGKGQEGIELAYDLVLSGQDGKKRIIKDRRGREVEYLEALSPTVNGGNLNLSIDQRLQYLSYRELKNAIKKHQAISGSVVILNVDTDEVFAMVNWPSYNPNKRNKKLSPQLIRNRAVTDYFEPASAIKPFSVASVLEHTKLKKTALINTSPGKIKVGGGVVRDLENYGKVDITTILKRSSNVGTTKLIQKLESPINLWDTYDRFGLGNKTGSNFPGESAGILSQRNTENPFVLATMSFGYGVGVTPLQLARAYSILGSYGVKRPVSFIKLDSAPIGFQVISKNASENVLSMLEEVAKERASRAKVIGYSVAGKTGTARKLGKSGYESGKHKAIYGGVIPAKSPRFAISVVINEPKVGGFYGNLVAAPVFAKISQAAARLYKLQPNIENKKQKY